METIRFEQLEFARNQTLKALDDVSEETALRIPDGFRNSILWQAGHIYVIQERFAFSFTGLEAQIPPNVMALFRSGSSPSSWEEQPPKLAEIKGMLREQQQRLEPALRGKGEEKAAQPYTTSSGLVLETIGQFLNFSLYHEGMHVQAIKMYKTLLK